MAFHNSIENITLANKNYRQVLYTTPQQQLVVMYLPANVEIGMERHRTTTQFIKVESGTGLAYIGKKLFKLRAGDSVIIPPNENHNIIATSDMHLYTIYSPPEHKDGLVQHTKP